jgi:tryptophan halogenase
MEAAQREFAMIRQMAGHALNDLPDHRALVEQLCREHAERVGQEDSETAERLA